MLLETKTCADLELSGESTTGECCGNEKRSQALIAGWIGEIGLVGHVEYFEEEVDRPSLTGLHPIAGAQVDLHAVRSVGATAAAGVLDGDGIQAGAAVCTCRNRIFGDVVTVAVDVAVMNRERRTGCETPDGSAGEARYPRHLEASTEVDRVTAIGTRWPFVLIQVALVEHLEGIGRRRRAVGVSSALYQGVRQACAPEVCEALFDSQVQTVVLRFTDVLDDPHVARERRQTEPARHTKQIDARDRRRTAGGLLGRGIQVIAKRHVLVLNVHVVGGER